VSPFRDPHPVVLGRVANFRDLGGHTTRDGARLRPGRIFRSGHLAHASDEDLKQLAELGVRRIFDFRTEADIAAEGGDRLPDGASYLRLPMPDPARHQDLRGMINGADEHSMEELFGDGRAAALMREAAELLVRERRDAYRLFLGELAREDYRPALFHCSAGKDRAGWAGSLVLLALGVEEEQVVEQYLLSNRSLAEMRARIASEEGGRSSWGALLKPFLEVRREYIEASFAAVQADWGGFDRYLQEGLGVTHAERDQLRESLLE
jgi:protein-tyrosine phosphatase